MKRERNKKMKQKHYLDIERVKYGDGLICPNIDGFKQGDIIQITEKLDGSNASMRYDIETQKLIAFSRKRELSLSNTLNGYWDFVQSLNPQDYTDTPDYIIFGEWSVHNAIHYDKNTYGKWYVFDIYDINTQKYLPQSQVKEFAKCHNLNYIHVLYEGPFISWEHCKTFCNSPAYGDTQEGIVIKNQTKLNDPDCRQPFVLKIVNDSFSEIKKTNRKRKLEDPEKLAEKEQASQIADKIVTKRRVEKEIYKMRDEGILPEPIMPQDMKTVAQNLPKRIYDDCVKEEKELVEAAGKYFSKSCSSLTMKYAREIVLGS